MIRALRVPVFGGGASEEQDARLVASYYPMSAGQGTQAALLMARTGDFPRQSVMVGHANDALVIEIDRLVELHLEPFRAALLELMKRETSKCEMHVLRPTLELRFQLPDCNTPEIGAHETEDAIHGQIGQEGREVAR